MRHGLRFHQDQQVACTPSDLETRGAGTRSHDPGSRPYHAGPWPSLPLSEHPTPGVVLTGVLTAGAPQNPVHGMFGLGMTLLLWGGTVGQVASSPSQRPGWVWDGDVKGQKPSGHRQPDNRTPKLCAEGLPNNMGTMCPDPHEQTQAQIRREFPETSGPNHWPPTVTCQKPPKIPEAPLHRQQPLRQ